MKKFSLSLLAAGAMALAGAVHADVIFYPDGTSVELGENGADQLALDSSLDTTVLGAGSSSMQTWTPSYTISQGVATGSCPQGDSMCLQSQGMVTGFNDQGVSSDSSMMAGSGLSGSVDTTVLGAGPSSTTTMSSTQSVYVQPNINFDPATARHLNGHILVR